MLNINRTKEMPANMFIEFKLNSKEVKTICFLGLAENKNELKN